MRRKNIPQDTRTPTSIHHFGRYTVKIFDETLYRQSLEQYGDEPVPHRARKKRPYLVPRKRRGINWARDDINTVATKLGA